MINSTTFVINLAALLLYTFDSGNPSLVFASIMVMNVMASRLYRNTKLGRYSSAPSSKSAPINSTLVFAHSSDTAGGPILPQSIDPNQSNPDDVPISPRTKSDPSPPSQPKKSIE
jgi:hypothetical protein